MAGRRSTVSYGKKTAYHTKNLIISGIILTLLYLIGSIVFAVFHMWTGAAIMAILFAVNLFFYYTQYEKEEGRKVI